jgi:hypothetical protein
MSIVLPVGLAKQVTVMNAERKKSPTAEAKNEHAVDKVDGEVFEAFHLAGIPGRTASRFL